MRNYPSRPSFGGNKRNGKKLLFLHICKSSSRLHLATRQGQEGHREPRRRYWREPKGSRPCLKWREQGRYKWLGGFKGLGFVAGKWRALDKTEEAS
jgi:hypothetical protein